MQDLDDKSTGGDLTAIQWNDTRTEAQNVVLGTGQTLSAGDANQLGKGVAMYAGNGDYYTDSGAADAYVLSVIGSKQAPPAFVDGLRFRFIAGNVPTGPSTINPAGLGVVDLVNADGNALTAGYFGTSEILTGTYKSSTGDVHLDRPVGGDYIKFTEQRASGVNGGAFNNGAWQTRLTTDNEDEDTGGNASISSGVITLAPGAYTFEAKGFAYDVDAHQLRLQNTADAATVAYGDTAVSDSTNNVSAPALLSGRFVITASKTFELQHRCTASNVTDGFGLPTTFGNINIYASIVFRKAS